MKEIRVEDSTFKRLENHARLFETEDAFINRILNELERKSQQTGSPVATNGSGPDSERRINPHRLPDLTHTKVLDAIVSGEMVERPNWNLLLKRIVRLAKGHAKTIEDLYRLCPANMVDGRKVSEGYHYLSDIDVSVQGLPANAAALAIVTAALKLDIGLDIGFRWRDKEGAEHPGERARIQTSGK